MVSSVLAKAQQDTLPVADRDAIQEVMNARYPKTYTIADIQVTGTQTYDPNLIISISGLALGEKILLPGSDVFSKAIGKLWKQNLVSDIQVLINRINGTNIYIELKVRERPRLINFEFNGIKKGEKDDLEKKIGLAKDRVITENMKINAVETIRKFYSEKGYRNVVIKVNEDSIQGIYNGVSLQFVIQKGNKVKVNKINFSGNEQMEDLVLKRQMKGTREMNRLTLYPSATASPYPLQNKVSGWRSFLNEKAWWYPSKIRDYLNPYVHVRPFSNAKFNEKKYEEDKEKLLSYYNAQGMRDAVLEADTLITNYRGNLDIYQKWKEGRRYYFGNITWRGNTKYSDSILTYLLSIKKGMSTT